METFQKILIILICILILPSLMGLVSFFNTNISYFSIFFTVLLVEGMILVIIGLIYLLLYWWNELE
jgi:hypothetical protein